MASFAATSGAELASQTSGSKRTIALGRSSTETIPVPLEAGTRLKWKFDLKQYDVAFSANFNPNTGDGKPIQVQPRLRLKQDESSYTATENGVLSLVFDNTYSRFRGKTVYLYTTVESVDEELRPTVETPFGIGVLMESRDADGVYVVKLDFGVAYLQASAVHIHKRASDQRACERALEGVNLFLDNRFQEAEDFFSEERNRLPMFALGHATLNYLKAIITWDEGSLTSARQRLEHVRTLCNTFTQQGGWWSGLTSMAGLLLSTLHLMEESVMGFLRAGMGIRSSWKTYQALDASLGGPVSKLSITTTTIAPPPAAATAATATAAATTADAPTPQPAAPPVPPTSAAPSGGAGGGAGASEGGGSGGAGAGAGAGDGGKAASTPVTPTPTGRELPLDPNGQAYDPEVRSGLLMGYGAFNVIISNMPPVVLKVVEALGFPSDRDAGMEQLRRSFATPGVHSVMSGIVLLFMHIILPSFFSADLDRHLPEATAIIEHLLRDHPDSAMVLWLAGRLARMERRVDKAIKVFNHGIGVQDEWPQYKHVCWYELGFCHMFMLQWEKAREKFAALEKENDSFQVFYTYQQAVCSLEMGDHTAASAAMNRVSSYKSKVKLGGKTLSIDQFVYRRTDEFRGGKTLMVPGVEMSYLFNGFFQTPVNNLVRVLHCVDSVLHTLAGVSDPLKWPDLTAKSSDAAAAAPLSYPGRGEAGVLHLLDAALVGTKGAALLPRLHAARAAGSKPPKVKPATSTRYDDVAVLALLHGAALLALRQPGALATEACAALSWVETYSSKVTRDRFVVPFARYELGVATKDARMLNRARDYKNDFNFKIRLHARVHLALDDLARRSKGGQ